MQKLPVDISTFSELRTSNYLYVDKTQHAYNLITGGRRYFLSRPRRFGKSLFVSTLKEILTGHKEFFDKLYIAQSDYEWKEWGVINLDFSGLAIADIMSFKNDLNRVLFSIAQKYNIAIDTTFDHSSSILKDLVDNLYKRFGRVAILIDEYDAPILKTLYNEAFAKEIRDIIQHFFTVIKSLDEYVQFVFITGVSSFAKAGLFSGINNLQILTLQDKYATICGYIDEEIDFYFHEYIKKWAADKNMPYDVLRGQIKSWYNGYRFGDKVPAVYNPFSVLNALHLESLKNFWFQSGTPTFLVEVLKKNEHTFDPTKFIVHEDVLGTFDVGKTPLIGLMFQAGYLTIAHYNPQAQTYNLQYPNEEVRVSFQKYLLEVFAHLRIVPRSSIISRTVSCF